MKSLQTRLQRSQKQKKLEGRTEKSKMDQMKNCKMIDIRFEHGYDTRFGKHEDERQLQCLEGHGINDKHKGQQYSHTACCHLNQVPWCLAHHLGCSLIRHLPSEVLG